MRFMLHHLTGSLRGKSQYFDADHLRFGTGKGCDVLFDVAKDPRVTSLHAELLARDGTPILRDESGQHALLINNRQTVEAALHDGDLLQFGHKGPLVRFRLLPNNSGPSKPWRYIVQDSRDMLVQTPHNRFTSIFHLIKHIASDIARYGTRPVQIIAGLMALVPIVLITMLGVTLYFEYQAVSVSEQRIAELLGQLETGRLSRTELERRIEQERKLVIDLRGEQEELERKLSAALDAQEAARRSREELDAIRAQLQALESGQHFAEEVIRKFQTGVGLIQGGYGLYETASGRPLRYQGFDEQGAPLRGEDGSPLVTLEGDTPPVLVFFAGTGFLIDKVGTVLTNRHLVRMWEVYEPLKGLLQSGFEPAPQFLRIFFPGTVAPYALQEILVPRKQDLAILQTKEPPKHETPLRLGAAQKPTHVGAPVIVMSYPGTFDGIMSRLPKETIDKVLQEGGLGPMVLPENLSKQGLIRPIATQGHVVDITSDVVTYEARSAGGSSGGPVLDREGLVIAVNHSELKTVGGMNLGVPVGFVRAELEKLKISDSSEGAN